MNAVARSSWAAITFASLMGAGFSGEGANAIVAIRAGRILAPESGASILDHVILIENGRIQAVGPHLEPPSDAKWIDLSDSTVLPGLMDCETHLCVSVVSRPDIPRPQERGSTGAAFYTTTVETTAYRAIQGVVHAKQVLDAGFTTARDLGHAGNHADLALRRAIEDGLVPGPTMITAGRILAPFGGQFQLQPEKPGILQPEYIFADTRDEMRKGIRENLRLGARVIKVVVDDQPYMYSTEDLRFIVEEAGAAGVGVVTHCRTEQGAIHAARAGVASILHAHEVSDGTLLLMKENQVVLIGTDFPLPLLRAMGWPNPEAAYARFVDRLRRAHALGVRLGFGTDVSWQVGNSSRGELAMSFIDPFVDAGIPPADILRAMVTEPARLMGIDGERGAIESGFAADIVATRGNPLEDIHSLKRIHFVMKEGIVIKNEGGFE